MAEFTVVELIGLMLGSGCVTGGLTLGGIHVHIRYLREADQRHESITGETVKRLDVLERDYIRIEGAARRAHDRIDRLESAS